MTIEKPKYEQTGTTVWGDDLNAIIGGGAQNNWAAETSYEKGAIIEADSRLWRQIGEDPNVSGATPPTWSGVTDEGVTLSDGTGFWQLIQGHRHDGQNFRGSNGKIYLGDGTTASDVRGTLPLGNMAGHVHDGAQASKVNPVDHVAGVSEADFNLVFPDTQFSTEQTVACRYRKETSPTSGKPAMVTVFFPEFFATSNGASFSDLGGHIPASIRPKADTYASIVVVDNGNINAGTVMIDENGAIHFGLFQTVSGDADSKLAEDVSAFTASGSKGFYAFAIVYPVWP